MKKIIIIAITILAISIVGCSKKKKSIENIRSEYNNKPTPRKLSILLKHYNKTDDLDNKIEILELFLKKFPKDKYAKSDIGKAYFKKSQKKAEKDQLPLLMKAVEYGYKGDLVVLQLTKLISAEIEKLKAKKDDEAFLNFLIKAKKMPLDKKLSRDISAKIDFLKNKKQFDDFFNPFKENFEKNAEEFIKVIFGGQGVTYDTTTGEFTIQGVAKIKKGKVDQAKIAAIDLTSDLLTILKYALEHGKQPPQGEDIEVIPLSGDALSCNEGTLSKDKKELTVTCKVNIIDLGKAFFSIRKELQEKNKKGDIKENKKEPKKDSKKGKSGK